MAPRPLQSARTGSLSGTVGRLLGTGSGRGIGLVLVLVGLIPVIAALVAFRSPRVRTLDNPPPDDGSVDPVPARSGDGR